MSHFERGGRLITYRSSEPEGSVAGTLVLLHAFPLSSAMWEPQLAAAPASWRVVAPDLAGFGASFPHPPGATIDDDARDVVALLDQLGVEQAVVGGLSMGGYIALALGRLAPGRLRGLVLADTRADADSEEIRRGRLQMLRTLETGGTASVVESMLPRLLGETTRRTRAEIVERVREIGSAQTVDGVSAATRKLMGRPDSTALLPGFDFPVLVVVGDEDVIAGRDVAWAMRARIPGGELAILEGAGHLSNLEAPEGFNQALFGFLGRRFSP
jgi:pimeloyl-ACP methyl ester carboxylesterase